MIGAITVQLEHLIAVSHDGEVGGDAMPLHIEYRSKKITLLQHTPHD